MAPINKIKNIASLGSVREKLILLLQLLLFLSSIFPIYFIN